MQNVPEEEFEALVAEQLDLLPDEMLDGVENVSFTVEDRPEDGSLRLLGVYHGVPLTERGEFGPGLMPDNIVLYREPMLAFAHDLDMLKREIHITLVHEIGHYFGMDDAKLHELGWG